MRNLIIILFIGLPVTAGIIWLQLFLSKKASKWLGLIMPLIIFAFSLLIVVGNIMYTGSPWETALLIVTTLLLSNIPTAILLAIYFACREQRKKRAQVEKMNIQDLG
ncbi:hypothetical protein SAMN02745823_03614 [Sporobacter termitidis DSM 10068]|uniref:Uncharacterized protein n=1 Tax=Sporobacter termitidis DSM 10068 TaxID=1123282 RepID=A0A1M5ZEN3_9FIRM|nr:hypothetical protein [Sporobacter termitidis]SHI22634.1 hypothetical protein SAMN02745823_03614 [Sporobacter termitidis DSM 10068]